MKLFFHFPGYIGCYISVIDLFTKWCSGRRSCDVPVPNTELPNVCGEELKSYLEISYKCVPGLWDIEGFFFQIRVWQAGIFGGRLIILIL